jgi:hypothetical protein
VRASVVASAWMLTSCRPEQRAIEPTPTASATPAVDVPAPARAAAPAPMPVEAAKLSPTPLAGRRVATGGIYNCAIRSGKVYCWGLARGHSDGKAFEIPGIDDAVEVAAGYESACARHASGRVTCWNEKAQYVVNGISGSNSVAVGAEVACATVGKGVACWSPYFREDDPPRAREVYGIEDPIQLAAGFYHACALERGGAVKCWGKDTDGSLGTADAAEPGFDRGAADDSTWVALAIDAGATPLDTKAFWKGASLERSLLACVRAIGATDERRTIEVELALDGEGNVTDVHPLSSQLGSHATLAMNRCAAKAYLSDTPKLPPPSRRATTARVKLFLQSRGGAMRTALPVMTGAVAVASNGYFSCGVLSDGSLQCWGYTHGFDGPGIHGDRLQSLGRAAPVDGVAGLATLSIGWRHACGQRTNKTHVCFGANVDGSFGSGFATSPKYVVQDVDKKGEYVEISAGPTMSCGLRKDDSVWCWGINDGGRLGIGHTKGGIHPPARVVGLPG